MIRHWHPKSEYNFDDIRSRVRDVEEVAPEPTNATRSTPDHRTHLTDLPPTSLFMIPLLIPSSNQPLGSVSPPAGPVAESQTTTVPRKHQLATSDAAESQQKMIQTKPQVLGWDVQVGWNRPGIQICLQRTRSEPLDEGCGRGSSSTHRKRVEQWDLILFLHNAPACAPKCGVVQHGCELGQKESTTQVKTTTTKNCFVHVGCKQMTMRMNSSFSVQFKIEDQVVSE
jgi:hypothetical protein